jgi:hypothetical protein
MVAPLTQLPLALLALVALVALTSVRVALLAPALAHVYGEADGRSQRD